MDMNYDGFDVGEIGGPIGADDIVLSQTLINNWLLCPMRVGLRNEPGYNLTPSLAMSRGSMIHAAIEADLDSIGTTDFGAWSPIAMEQLWVDSLLNEREGSWNLHDLASRAVIKREVDLALVALDKWHATVWPTLGWTADSDLLIEQREHKLLGISPSGIGYWLAGTADVVDRDLDVVHDWKSSKRKWKQSKADSTHQASCYTYLYGINRHSYHVFSYGSKKWDRFDTVRKPAVVDAFLKLAWQVGRSIEHGAYPPTNQVTQYGETTRGWFCSARWCEAWDVCPAKAQNDDVYTAQPISVEEGWL